ncbi:MAG: hypothetical protein GXY18_12735 [Methanomicrobiales archaeon]|nr:hypothetical protein [Methanomicrobiales archaeon]
MKTLYSIGIIIGLVLLTMHGVFAESLISFDQNIKPNPYATDDLISRAGTMNIPAGIGVLTSTEIIEPYWAPKDDILPIRVEFSPVNENGPIAELSIVGQDMYQFGNEVKGLSFSNGVPLNIVTKYLINSSANIPYYVILRNSLDKGDTIHDFNLAYSAEYEPITYNRTAYSSGNPEGTYKTSMGDINLSFSEKSGWFPYLQGKFGDGYIIGGTLNGPVWSGLWGPDDTIVEQDPYKIVSGQFMVIFHEGWSSFSGTKGIWHSCSNDGPFTGEKVTV